jgi:hypothetical protein
VCIAQDVEGFDVRLVSERIPLGRLILEGNIKLIFKEKLK